MSWTAADFHEVTNRLLDASLKNEAALGVRAVRAHKKFMEAVDEVPKEAFLDGEFWRWVGQQKPKGLIVQLLNKLTNFTKEEREIVWEQADVIFRQNIPGGEGWREDIASCHITALRSGTVKEMGREMREATWAHLREAFNGQMGEEGYWGWRLLLADPQTEEDILLAMAETGAWKETLVCEHRKATEAVWVACLAHEVSDMEARGMVGIKSHPELLNKYFGQIVAKRKGRPGIHFWVEVLEHSNPEGVKAGIEEMMSKNVSALVSRFRSVKGLEESAWALGFGEAIVRKAMGVANKETREWAISRLPKLAEAREQLESKGYSKGR